MKSTSRTAAMKIRLPESAAAIASRTVRLLTLVSAALLVGAPRPAEGQAVLRRLEPGTAVRVQTVNGRRVQGTVARVDSASIVVVDSTGTEHPLPGGEIEKVWRRTSSAGRFAAGGATVGAALTGTYLALLAVGFCDAASCEGEGVRGFLVGAPVGAGAGAVTGLIIGSLVPRWEEIAGGGARPVPGVEVSLHAGRSSGSASREPAPVSMLRVGIGKGVAPSRLALLEVTRLDFAASTWLIDPSSPVSARVGIDASTWTLALGVAQGAGAWLRATASVGLARSTVSSFIERGTYFQDDRSERFVQYSSQLSAGVEAVWAPARDGRLRVGFEGRYDYIPLLFDGLHVLTLSIAVRG